MKNKLYSLQILRGFAAALVVIYHITKHYFKHGDEFLHNVFLFGYSGVDIFFVLSGFLMFYLFDGNHSLKSAVHFVSKRIIRIYPSYWILLLFPIFLLVIFYPSFVKLSDAINIKEMVKLITLSFNHITLSQVTWTLSFEVYFYLLFTIFVLNKKTLPILILIILLCLLNLLRIKTGIRLLDNYFFKNICLEFILGIMAAFIIKKTTIPYKYGKILVFIGGSMFMSSFLLTIIDTDIPVRYYRTIFFGIPTFILIIGLVIFETGTTINRNNIFVKFGDASYTTYLIHSPLASASSLIIFKYYDEGNTLLSLAAFLLIHAISLLVYYKIEIRIISLGKKLLKKNKSSFYMI